ncbi:MAG: DUF3800 domain-containing protein, partial [Nitrosotalea sp.]
MDVHVFVDESGDLGFSGKSSPFFTLGYAIMLNDNSKYIENKTRRLRKNMNRSKKITGMQEFKFSNDSDVTKMRFLNKIINFDLKIGTIIVSKDSVKSELIKDKALLYNYIAVHEVIDTIIGQYLKPNSPYNNIYYTIDKSSSVSEKDFNEYCKEKIEYLAKPRKFVGNINAVIKHLDSKSHSCLQVADYV